ncbi:MAG: response regulator [Halobacteriota archaeon]
MTIPVRVLHVDDEPGFAELTAEFLEREDDRFEVVTETSASAGLDRLEAGTFDCIVSDYQMPHVDGIEFLRRVREDLDLDLPFVIFTGHGREAVAIEALNLGADRYVQKGGDPTTQYGVLAQAISQSVEHHRSVREREEAEKRYRSLFENNPVVIWEEDFSAAKAYADELAATVDDLGAHLREDPAELDRILERVTVLDVNRNAVEYYGAASKAQLIDSLPRLMTPDSRAAIRSMWVAIADGQTRFRAETESMTIDGDRRDEILELYVPEAYAEDYSRVYITGTEITDRKRRERQLERERDLLDAVIDAVPHPLYVLNVDDYAVAHANESATVSEGETCYAVTHQRDRPCDEGDGETWACPIADVSESGAPAVVEHVHYDEAGEKRRFEVHAAPVFDDDGEVVQIVESNVEIPDAE